jgi:hypothetical protein
MNYKLLVLIALLLSGVIQTYSQNNDTIQGVSDSIIFTQKVATLKGLSHRSGGELVCKIARSFINTPYKGKTLDGNQSESLVINLRELDCTTFVESDLALVMSIKSAYPSYEEFKKNLEKLRYRNGKLCGYSSRLHYFCDWITDNQEKSIIKDVTKELGGIPFKKEINFMSSHPGYYARLKDNQSLIDSIKVFEKEITMRDYYYIPKEKVKLIESKLKEGMIVAITSSQDGLDIAHLGFLVKSDKRIYLLHASSDAGKVIISQKPLSDYLAGNKKQTGIMVLKVN